MMLDSVNFRQTNINYGFAKFHDWTPEISLNLKRHGRAIFYFDIEISKCKSSFLRPKFKLEIDVVNTEFSLDQLIWLSLQTFAISNDIDFKIPVLALHSELVVYSTLSKLFQLDDSRVIVVNKGVTFNKRYWRLNFYLARVTLPSEVKLNHWD